MAVIHFLDFGASMYVSACTFLGSRLTPCWEIISSPKEGNAGASEKRLIFLNLQVCLPAYPEYLV